MKTIIVVEGKSDTRRLKEVFPNIITFETSGLGLDQEKLDQLKELGKVHKLVIFTDPDGPGEIIRNRIIENIENIQHAYIKNSKAVSKDMKKVGIEHASDEEIKIALKNLYSHTVGPEIYDMNYMVENGIYNNKNMRKELCDFLHIAFGNNKKVLKQLNYFQVDIERTNKFIEEYNDKT